MRRLFFSFSIVVFTIFALCKTAYTGHTHHKGGLHFVDSIVTEHAFLERKLRLDISTFHNAEIEKKIDGEEAKDEGEKVSIDAELEWAFTERFSMTLEIPFVFLDADTLSNESRFGDFEIGGKYLFINSTEKAFLSAFALKVSIPSGNSDRGIGEDGVALEPALLFWKGIGHFSLQSEAKLDIPLDTGPIKTKGIYNFVLGYTFKEPEILFLKNFTPMLEFNGATILNGPNTRETLIQLTPGFRIEPTSNLEIGMGIQFPVTDNEEYDLKVISSINYHF